MSSASLFPPPPNISLSHLKLITIYYSADLLKNYRIDENSTVVCYLISIFVFHLKLIAAGCNAITIS